MPRFDRVNGGGPAVPLICGWDGEVLAAMERRVRPGVLPDRQPEDWGRLRIRDGGSSRCTPEAATARRLTRSPATGTQIGLHYRGGVLAVERGGVLGIEVVDCEVRPGPGDRELALTAPARPDMAGATAAVLDQGSVGCGWEAG
jgi:hypothetical protein